MDISVHTLPFCMVLEFLKSHLGEWWTPNEIRLRLKKDLRTVKSEITGLRRTHHWTTYNGYRFEVAERERTYAVRLVRDISGCIDVVRQHIEEVESIPTKYLSSLEVHSSLKLIEKWSPYRGIVHTLHRHLRSGNLNKVVDDIVTVKSTQLENLSRILSELDGLTNG